MKIKVTGRFFDDMKKAIGKNEVVISLGSKKTVGDFLDILYNEYGKTLKECKIEKSLIHEIYIIQVNKRHIRLLKGLKTKLSDRDVIDIIPIIGGG